MIINSDPCNDKTRDPEPVAADVVRVLEAALDKYAEVRAQIPALERFGSLEGAEAVAEYILRYRRNDVLPLEIGGPLDLFPAEPLPCGMTPGLNWTNPWPFAHQAGVYLIYSAGLELLYIGKASMNRCLGQRLYDYFGSGDACVLRQGFWAQRPRFVLNLAVPGEMAFEAPAIEEFLIRRLRPAYNVCGLAA